MNMLYRVFRTVALAVSSALYEEYSALVSKAHNPNEAVVLLRWSRIMDNIATKIQKYEH